MLDLLELRLVSDARLSDRLNIRDGKSDMRSRNVERLVSIDLVIEKRRSCTVEGRDGNSYRSTFSTFLHSSFNSSSTCPIFPAGNSGPVPSTLLLHTGQ